MYVFCNNVSTISISLSEFSFYILFSPANAIVKEWLAVVKRSESFNTWCKRRGKKRRKKLQHKIWLQTMDMHLVGNPIPPPTWTWGGFKNLPLSRGKHLGVGGESGAKLRDNGVECCNHCCSGTGHTQPGIDSQREGRGAGAVGGCQPLARVIWLHCTSHHTTSPLPHVLHVQPAPSRVKKRPAQCGVFSYQNTHKLALQKNNKKKREGP